MVLYACVCSQLKAFEKTIQGFKQDLWMREETLRTLQPTLTEYQQQAQVRCKHAVLPHLAYSDR